MPDQELTIRIGAATREAQQQIEQVTRRLQDLGATARRVGSQMPAAFAWASRVSDALTQMQKGLDRVSNTLTRVSAVMTAALAGLGAGAFRAAQELERLQLQFRVITGSTAGAARMLEQIRALSERSAFDFKVLAEAAAKIGSTLRGVGADVSQTIPFLDRLQKLATAFGVIRPEDFEGVVRAFTQIIAKGRVQMEELLQLSERNIPAQAMLAKALGLTAEQMAELGKQGIPAAKAINAILQEAEKMGMTGPAPVNSLTVAFSNLRQTVWMAFATLGQTVGAKIVPILQQMKERIDAIVQDPSFKVFAQRIAEAAQTVTGWILRVIEVTGNLIKRFQELPEPIQRGLSLLAVGGPLVLGAVAGITKITSAVLGLVKLFTVDLVRAIGTALGWLARLRVSSTVAVAAGAGGVGGAGGAAAAGAGAGAAVTMRQRVLQMLGRVGKFAGTPLGVLGSVAATPSVAGGATVEEAIAAQIVAGRGDEAIRIIQQRFIPEIARHAKTIVETAQSIFAQQAAAAGLPTQLVQRYAEQQIAIALQALRTAIAEVSDPLRQRMEEEARKAREEAKQAEEALKRWTGLQLPRQPTGAGTDAQRRQRESERRRQQVLRQEQVDLQAQLTMAAELVKLAEARFQTLIAQGELMEAEKLLHTEIKQLLERQSNLQVTIQQTELARMGLASERVVAILKESEALERERKLSEYQAQIEAARQQMISERRQQWEKQVSLLRQEIDMMLEQWRRLPLELQASDASLAAIRAKLAELEVLSAGLAGNEQERAVVLWQISELYRRIAEEQQRARELYESMRRTLPVPEGAPISSPPQVTPVMPLLEQPGVGILPPRYRPPAVPPEVAVIRARAVEERARIELEFLRAQLATRQQLRAAEQALVQATLERLQVEKQVLETQLSQLRVQLQQLETSELTRDEDVERLQRLRIDIAETEAALERIEAQIRVTSEELKRNNPFEEFKRGVEDAFVRFEDAVADALAGVGRLSDAFRSLWQDIKRQFWRIVVRETFAPFFNWLREMARQAGEWLWGSIGIGRAPVLSLTGLVPPRGRVGLPLPLPPIILPPVLAGAGAAAAAAAMGANKETAALVGAAVGFAVGGPVGAVIGGLVGLFGGKKKKKSGSSGTALGVAVYGPSLTVTTNVNLWVDGKGLGRVIVRQTL